jgi:hypothetical protein
MLVDATEEGLRARKAKWDMRTAMRFRVNSALAVIIDVTFTGAPYSRVNYTEEENGG